MCVTEGERFLQEDKEAPSRSVRRVLGEPRARLLRGEDWQRQGIPELDEGSKSVQQAEAKLLVTHALQSLLLIKVFGVIGDVWSMIDVI